MSDAFSVLIFYLMYYKCYFFTVDKNKNLIYEERKFDTELKAGEKAVESLLNIEEKLFNHARRSKEMQLTAKDIQTITQSDSCHICEQKFEKGQKRVRDHDHYEAENNFLG